MSGRVTANFVVVASMIIVHDFIVVEHFISGGCKGLLSLLLACVHFLHLQVDFVDVLLRVEVGAADVLPLFVFAAQLAVDLPHDAAVGGVQEPAAVFEDGGLQLVGQGWVFEALVQHPPGVVSRPLRFFVALHLDRLPPEKLDDVALPTVVQSASSPCYRRVVVRAQFFDQFAETRLLQHFLAEFLLTQTVQNLNFFPCFCAVVSQLFLVAVHFFNDHNASQLVQLHLLQN